MNLTSLASNRQIGNDLFTCSVCLILAYFVHGLHLSDEAIIWGTANARLPFGRHSRKMVV